MIVLQFTLMIDHYFILRLAFKHLSTINGDANPKALRVSWNWVLKLGVQHIIILVKRLNVIIVMSLLIIGWSKILSIKLLWGFGGLLYDFFGLYFIFLVIYYLLSFHHIRWEFNFWMITMSQLHQIFQSFIPCEFSLLLLLRLHFFFYQTFCCDSYPIMITSSLC